MRKPVLGYIVETTGGGSQMIDGVLWFGRQVTLFKSRDHARLAVLRTRTYARKHGYHWSQYDHPIYSRVVRP